MEEAFKRYPENENQFRFQEIQGDEAVILDLSAFGAGPGWTGQEQLVIR